MTLSYRSISENGVKDLIQPTQIEYKMCETISTRNVTVSDENNLDCEDFCQVTDNILKFITRV